MDGFTEMVDAATPFFAALKANNTKEWFEPRKADYVKTIRKPAELFADIMAEDISRVTGETHAAKVFRIYRDVRFSKDKTPYNPWLHILWSPQRDSAPSVFFACEGGEVRLFLGLAGLKGEGLTRYRALVDRMGDALQEEIARIGGDLVSFGSEPLKRVPKPYDANHPHAELLKRKSFIVRCTLPVTWRDVGLVAAARTQVSDFTGLRQLLLSF